MKLNGWPSLVRMLVLNHNAWLIGGAAKAVLNNEDLDGLRDWDVHVPFSEWAHASLLIPAGSQSNSFGGWKVIEKDVAIDIWPGDVGEVVSRYGGSTHCLHPLSGTHFVTRKMGEEILNH